MKKQLFDLDIELIKNNLSALEPLPKNKFTVADIAIECKSQIASVLKKGYDFSDICKAIFEPQGIKIDPSYLKREYNKLVKKPRVAINKLSNSSQLNNEESIKE